VFLVFLRRSTLTFVGGPRTGFSGSNNSSGTTGSIAGLLEANLSIRIGPFLSFDVSDLTRRRGGGATEGFDSSGGTGFDGDDTGGLAAGAD